MTERDQVRAEIKRRLNSYRDLLTEHAQLAEELFRMEILMASPSSPNMDGMPRSGSGPSNPTERAALKHMELVDRYKAQIRQMIEEQAAIETMIEDLEPTERKLARFRYIDGLTWEAVSEKMNYCERQIHRIHGQMIEKLITRTLENQ